MVDEELNWRPLLMVLPAGHRHQMRMRRDILNDTRAYGFISRRPYAEACHPLQRTLVGTAIFLSIR